MAGCLTWRDTVSQLLATYIEVKESSFASLFETRHLHQFAVSLSTEHKSCIVSQHERKLNILNQIDRTDSHHLHVNQWWHLRAAGQSASFDMLFMAAESQCFTFLQPSVTRPDEELPAWQWGCQPAIGGFPSKLWSDWCSRHPRAWLRSSCRTWRRLCCHWFLRTLCNKLTNFGETVFLWTWVRLYTCMLCHLRDNNC